MSTLAQQVATNLNGLRGYTGMQLLAGVMKMSPEEQQRLNKDSDKLYRKLQGVKQVLTKRKKQKEPTIPKSLQIDYFIVAIQDALTRYEASELQPDTWDMDFEVGDNLDTYKITELIVKHQKIESTENSANKLKLLCFCEKGRIFYYLKHSPKWTEVYPIWTDCCFEFGVGVSTVDKYIQFYSWIAAYPRLLVVEQPFETLMVNRKDLIAYLKTHTTLRDKLRQPLRDTSARADLRFNAACLPQGGTEMPELFASGGDWNAGYRIRDAIRDKLAAAAVEDEDEDEYQSADEDHDTAPQPGQQ